VDVLVAPTGQRHEEHGLGPDVTAEGDGSSERVRRFDGREDALGAAEQPECLHGLGIGRGAILRASGLEQVGVLRADARIVQSR